MGQQRLGRRLCQRLGRWRSLVGPLQAVLTWTVHLACTARRTGLRAVRTGRPAAVLLLQGAERAAGAAAGELLLKLSAAADHLQPLGGARRRLGL
jgi:hypothetical protein